MFIQTDFSISDDGRVLYRYTGSDSDVVIPDGIWRIKDNAFSNCPNLTSITLPSSVASYGKDAFEGCEKLKRIYISDLAAFMKIRFYGMAYSIPGLLKTRELYLDGKLVEDLIIPSTLTETGDMFREYSMLKSVVIPEQVTEISKEAFQGCKNLKKIVITRNLKEIHWDAFSGTEDLALYIPDLDYYKTMPKTWMEFFKEIYIENNPLTHYAIEPGTTEIKEGQFARLCQLESVIIPDTVTSIGNRAFYNCISLSLQNLPESVTSIGELSFSGCTGLTVKKLPDSITIIKRSAFWRTGITELELPKNLKVIESGAFGWTGMKTLRIPASVEEIGPDIVYRCDNLTDVYFESVVEKIDKETFSNNDSLAVHFPEGALATKDKLPVGLCSTNFTASNEEIAWIILYQKAKAWKDWALNKKIDNPNAVFDQMITICANEKKPPLDILAGYMIDHFKELNPDTLKKSASLLEEKKYKDLPELRKRPEFKTILSGVVVEENPIEARVRELSVQSPIASTALDAVKKGIPYACSKQVSSREAVAFVLSEYAKEWGRCSDEIVFYNTVPINLTYI